MAENEVKNHTGLIAIALFIGGLLWLAFSKSSNSPTVSTGGDAIADQQPVGFTASLPASPDISYNFGGATGDEPFTLPLIQPRSTTSGATSSAAGSGSGSCSGCSGCSDDCAGAQKVISPTTLFNSLTPEYLSQQTTMLENSVSSGGSSTYYAKTIRPGYTG